jgi:DNA-binding transcriptional MerR regulator
MLNTDSELFDQTTGSLARLANVLPETVRAYADLELIECLRLENGVRMFKSSAAARVKEIRAERMAHRGGRRVARAST